MSQCDGACYGYARWPGFVLLAIAPTSTRHIESLTNCIAPMFVRIRLQAMRWRVHVATRRRWR